MRQKLSCEDLHQGMLSFVVRHEVFSEAIPPFSCGTSAVDRKKKKKKINKIKCVQKGAEIPGGPWQKVDATHSEKKNRPCEKEKFNLTSAGPPQTEKTPFYVAAISEHMND